MRCERLLVWSAALVVVTALSCSSNSSNGPVGPSTVTLRAPTDLSVQRVSPDTIVIAWQYNPENAHGIRIERSVGGASSFALRDTVLTNVSNYTDTPLQAGTTYYYRVRGYTGSSISDPSATVWGIAAVDAPPSSPSSPQPGNLAFDVPVGPITLTWSASDPDGGDQMTYDVMFGRTLGGMTKVANGITETSFAVAEQAVANAHYFWQVTVRDSKGAMRIGPLWGFNTLVERVTIPPDSASALFIMGERNRHLSNGDPNPFWHPGNPVRVEQFDMDKYVVTNQQFADFLNLAIHSNPRQIFTTGGKVYDPGAQVLYAQLLNTENPNGQITYDHTDSLFTVIPGRESFPAIELTWDGAAAYASFFGRRLPTEAEWEFAARGNAGESGDSTLTVGPDSSQTTVTVGFGRLYPWGDTLDPRRCNYLGSGDPYEGRGRITSTPVGFFDGLSHGGFATRDGSSQFGVQDMAGNVWEWCQDWYGPYRNPHSPPPDGLYKIIRGGSWAHGPNAVRSTNRSYASPTVADWAIGFRTVKSTQ